MSTTSTIPSTGLAFLRCLICSSVACQVLLLPSLEKNVPDGSMKTASLATHRSHPSVGVTVGRPSGFFGSVYEKLNPDCTTSVDFPLPADPRSRYHGSW